VPLVLRTDVPSGHLVLCFNKAGQKTSGWKPMLALTSWRPGGLRSPWPFVRSLLPQRPGLPTRWS